MPVKAVLRPLLGVVIAAVCIMAVARSVNVGDVAESLRRSNPVFLIPAIGLYFAGTAVRSVRWQHLLGGFHVPFTDLFRALVIGLMANDVLPGRPGEIARIFLVARHGVPVGTSVAVIVVERVLDGIALTALLGVGIALSGQTGWMLDVAAASAALFTVVTIILLWAASVPGPARWVGLRLVGLLPSRFDALRRPLEHVIDTGLTGLAAMGRPVAAVRVLALSLVAWVLEASMYLVLMAGFHVPGGPAASFMGAGAANLATLIPTTPGYVGPFDVALQKVLEGVFSASADEAAAFTITVHLVLIIPVVALGFFFLWRENISLPDLTRRPRPEAESTVAGRPGGLL